MKSIFVLALICFAGAAQAQTQTVNLTVADSGTAQLAPRIEHRDGRAYFAYIQAMMGSNGDIMLATRAAGQQAFSNPVSVTNTGKVNATLQRGPEFVVAPDGTIHMVWMEQRIANSPDIFYSRGTKNGTEWTQAVDISQDQQIGAQDFPSIAADSLGNVYVAWIDNRDKVGGKSSNDHVYLTRSFNGGMTWDTPRRAERNPGAVGGSCECCRTAIAASADGDLYIAYRTNMDHVRDIFVARSNDKGETFDESIRVQTKEWIVHACPATGPMVALDARENLHVVYRSAANANKAVIFYNLLPNGLDRTFTEIPLTPVGGSSANYADIAVTDSGALSVAYQQSGKIYQRTSSDGGGGWRDAVVIDTTESTQSFPIISSDDKTRRLSILWQDDRRDKNDIVAIEQDFSPFLYMPWIGTFNRAVDGDSVRFSWTPSPMPMTWFIIRLVDTTIVTFENSITIPRSYNDHASVLLTPVRSLGPGDTYSYGPLSVSAEERATEETIKHAVTAGQRLPLTIQIDRQLVWSVYDVQGRSYGAVVSDPTSGGHEMHIPSLTPGVYALRCAELGSGVTLVVVPR